MTLDECIAYLENVSAEKKPRSKKARQILRYLYDLKDIKERGVRSEIGKELFDKGYKCGWNRCVTDSLVNERTVDYID